MREIKFRAWQNDYKRMIPDFLNEAGWKGAEFINAWHLDCYDIMQFTGLRDKSGVEIYEGDIVVLREFMPRGDGGFDDVLAECKWCDEHSGFALSGIKPFVDVMILIIDADCEVIGNIHENPELLEKSKGGR